MEKEKFTNAERCKRRRIKRDYEIRVSEYYARGGTSQNMRLPYAWTEEDLENRLKKINEYNPLFLGQKIDKNLMYKQLAKLINNEEDPSLTFCHIGTQIMIKDYKGLPMVIVGMIHRAYYTAKNDIFFTPQRIAELLRNVLTNNEIETLKEIL